MARSWVVTVKDSGPLATAVAVEAVPLIAGWLFQVTVVSDDAVGAGVTLNVRVVFPELAVRVSTAVVTVQRVGMVGRAKLTRVRWFNAAAETTERVLALPLLALGEP